MGALSAWELTLEHHWEALWARVVGKEPVELLAALRRECDDHAVVCSERLVVVPNAYDVELDAAVHDELTRRDSHVGQALTDSLARHADREGYVWAGPLTVRVVRSSHLPNGRYRVAGRATAHVGAEAVAEQPRDRQRR
ncbi:DUF3662 domain-containing protein [Streptomyces sp. NPDC002265]|uniref:DUF3662 domain-containing protein n=1 Tax=Streptomyces sp. NPDC002265 TaxID=3154415 RepID=UPI00332CA711